MMLAHVFSDISMVDKSSIGSDDLIYNAVEYVAKNFRDEIKLDKLRKQNGWSQEDLAARLRVSRLNSIRMGIYFFISEIRKNFFELDLFLNILLHIQHVHYKNLLIMNIIYPLFF